MTPISNERDALLGNIDVKKRGDVDESDSDDDYESRKFVPLKDKTWSFSHSRRNVVTNAPSIPSPQTSVESRKAPEKSKAVKEEPRASNLGQHYLFCFIYAVVNVIIAVPGLFGYAAVIFNHPIYANHMNALSKCK